MILIDDFYHSSSNLSPIGKNIFYPEIESLYGKILFSSIKKNWQIIKYSDFVNWVAQKYSKDFLWLVLDNLFPIDLLFGEVIKLHIHRNYIQTNKGYKLSILTDETKNIFVTSLPVVILDDAIYTGNTIKTIISEYNLSMKEIMILSCCSKTKAVQHFSAIKDCKIEYLSLAGDKEDILHLHDFIPFFPYSGRRIQPVIEGALPVRISASLYNKGEWLHIEPGLYSEIVDFLKTIILKMTEYLNRPPVVSDITILGNGVEMQLKSALHNVGADSYITDFFNL